MITFLRTYWSQIGSFIAALGMAWFIGMALHNADVARLKDKSHARLTAQIAADVKKCSDDKKLTGDANHDFYSGLTGLNAQRDSVRVRADSAACIPLKLTDPAAVVPKSAAIH